MQLGQLLTAVANAKIMVNQAEVNRPDGITINLGLRGKQAILTTHEEDQGPTDVIRLEFVCFACYLRRHPGSSNPICMSFTHQLFVFILIYPNGIT